MNAQFDKFYRSRIPTIVLCNPDEEELFALSDLSERRLTLRYNAVSEFTFSVRSKRGNGELVEYYDLIKTTRLIKIEGVGYFVICNVAETRLGQYAEKTVSCKSLEIELADKGMSLLEGTYKFYDPLSSDETIMRKIMALLPAWSIGEIDENLWNLYRTFEITEKNLYDFMVSDIEEAYECLFVFDFLNKKVSAYSIANAVHPTDIFISDSNVIKELEINEDSNEIRTALNVYGADDITIQSVNPLGGNLIYDFSYYKTTEWMSQSLIDAISKWEERIKSSKESYSTLLSSLKIYNAELLGLNTELTELEGQLESLENVKSVQAEKGLSLIEINEQIRLKEGEIETKQAQIKVKRTQIGDLQLQQQETTTALSFEKNFTPEQYAVLSRFIKVGTYKNEAFVITESMEEAKKQDTIQGLYDVGLEVLKRVAQPKLTFSISAMNFLNLSDYAPIIQMLELGSEIAIQVENGLIAYPVLLEMEINYDSVTDLTLGFGNRLRLDKSEYTLAEIFKDAVNVAGDVNFNKGKWSEGLKAKNAFNEFLNSSLNASLQEIINSNNMETVIDGSGIRCRRLNPETSLYDPEQLWITGKSILFSKDNFDTASLAIGRVQLPDGTWSYGINAQVILGKLMATNQLIVENEGGTFRVDADGVTIKDGNILMTNDKGQEETLETVLSNTITKVYDDMNELNQATQDGMIEIFYQAGTPTSNDGKDGDLWYDTTIVNGVPKNEAWLKKHGVWVQIKDKEILDALANASKAQETADGKIKTYWQAEPPTGLVAKDVGDLWFDTNDGNKQYRWNGYEWIVVQDKAIDKIASDLSNAIQSVYKSMEEMEQAIKDGEIVIFYQGTTPLNAKEGDLWYNTAEENKAYIFKNGTWETIQDGKVIEALKNAENAQNTADGKIKTYWQNEPPTGLTVKDVGDLWFDTNAGNKQYRWNGYGWINVQDSGITDANNKIDNVINPDTGEIRTDKLIGSISAGKNNIDIVDTFNTKAMKLNEVGILIANSKSGSAWNWKTAISADGIVADYIQANGTLTGVNIKGGTLGIGGSNYDNFKVNSSGSVSATDLNITGGSISLGNAFKVDRYGNMSVGQNFKVTSAGKVTASNIEITGGTLNLNNLTMTGTISWGQLPDDVLNTESLSWGNLQGRPYYLESNRITRTSIESPNIIGGNITGATITQASLNSSFCHSQLIGGRLQFYKSSVSNNIGTLCGDATDEKMWVEGTNALKLTAYRGDISLQPQGQYGDLNTRGTIWLYGKVVVRGGVIVDENDNPLVGGSAVFG